MGVFSILLRLIRPIDGIAAAAVVVVVVIAGNLFVIETGCNIADDD